MTMTACGRSTPPPVELWLAGDVYLGSARPVVDEALQAELRGFGVVNLEGPVGTALPVDEAHPVRLVHDARVLPSLAGAGVRAASLANNHAGDAGDPGLAGGAASATVDALAAAGLAGFGCPTVATVDGVTFASYDLSDGGPHDLGAQLDALPHPLVVAFHVAGPADPTPLPALRDAVDLAVAARAEVVVAHGTHVFGPVERRGDSVIAWGLGNLAFDCACTHHTDGLALIVTLPAAGATGTTSARVVPLHAGLGGEPARLAFDTEAYLDALAALSPTPLVRDARGATF